MELVAITDERFAEARAFAQSLDGDDARDAKFRAAFPELPTPGLAGRDFASFSTEQRALVMELLLAGRFQLALVGELPDGRRVLLTHAGVTNRELAMLGVAGRAARDRRRARGPAREPRSTACAPTGRAASRRRCRSSRSTSPGVPGEEGGGLLYHRPTNPERAERRQAVGARAGAAAAVRSAHAADRPDPDRRPHRPQQVPGRARRRGRPRPRTAASTAGSARCASPARPSPTISAWRPRRATSPT